MRYTVIGLCIIVIIALIGGVSTLFAWYPLIDAINNEGKSSFVSMNSELVEYDKIRAINNGDTTDCLTFYTNLYYTDSKTLAATRMYYYFSADNKEKTSMDNVNNAFIIEKYVNQFNGDNLLVCQAIINNPDITAETITESYLDGVKKSLSESS